MNDKNVANDSKNILSKSRPNNMTLQIFYARSQEKNLKTEKTTEFKKKSNFVANRYGKYSPNEKNEFKGVAMKDVKRYDMFGKRRSSYSQEQPKNKRGRLAKKVQTKPVPRQEETSKTFQKHSLRENDGRFKKKRYR